MTQSDIKPWSQLDDELEEDEGAPGSPMVDARAPAGREDRGWKLDSSTGAGNRRAYMRIAPRWALVPMCAAGLWTLWSLFRSAGDQTSIPTFDAIGIFVLILVGSGLLIAGLRARKALLADVLGAIARNKRQLPDDLDHLPISAELRPLWQAIEQHTTNIERRAVELLEQHRQLGLELSLAETHRRHAEAIIDSVSESVLVTDAFDQVILANTAAERLFEFARGEALRRPVAEVLSDERLVRLIRQAREADSRAGHRRVEHEIGSETYSLGLSPLPLGGEGGSGSSDGHGVVAIFRNITKEREAAKNKSEFVAHVVHELRTPLSSIRAYVEMLVDGEAVDEKTREDYYNIIQTSADRLGRMIDNMLNISRIEAGTVRTKKEPVAISMIVKEATDVARPQAREKGITLTEELTPVIYRVTADRDMIYQAVLNLLSNAIKYTPEGGKVHVRMLPQEENRAMRIEVSDTGVGIPKEDLPRMFEKFFRVEANKKMANGTGLGLNLVKHIVETVHDGKMTLSSETGKGSTFGMILPLMT